MLRQSLLTRKPKVDVAKLFVGVLTRDKNNKPKTLIVPGSQGKQYHVIVRRFPNLMVTLECNLETGKGFVSCPGNGPHKKVESETICYHSRAALDFCMSEAGYRGIWCTSVKDAERINQINKGQIVTVKSHQNRGGIAFVVIIKAEK